MSAQAHQQLAETNATRRPARCCVLTISDTRTPATDAGGNLIELIVREASHVVVGRALVRDEAPAIRSQLDAWISSADVDVILCTGGTGISSRDTTIEVVRALLTAELEGFGELFRMLSWEQVGASAMMSRAVGGLVTRSSSTGGDTFIFAMPGSPNAVETAMRKLIAPQLSHLLWERRR